MHSLGVTQVGKRYQRHLHAREVHGVVDTAALRLYVAELHFQKYSAGIRTRVRELDREPKQYPGKHEKRVLFILGVSPVPCPATSAFCYPSVCTVLLHVDLQAQQCGYA